ncbi:MAG: hypothetical protein OEY01_11180 [Desulfobulbaceae bacterium]|nr:hypothetical protein [Desulfobulbaceae bacterium]
MDAVIITSMGSLMSILLFIIGYFLKMQITVIEELTVSVNILSRTVAVLENKTENSMLNCDIKHNTIDSRLKRHGERLDVNEKEIAILKEKVK